MLNVQIGLPGDVDASSFVDRDLHGGDEKVASLQQELMCQAAVLRGTQGDPQACRVGR